MKKEEFKKIIQQVVREEIITTLPTVLKKELKEIFKTTLMELRGSKAPKTVSDFHKETNHGMKLSKQLEEVTKRKPRQRSEKKNYSKNNMLNEMLNITANEQEGWPDDFEGTHLAESLAKKSGLGSDDAFTAADARGFGMMRGSEEPVTKNGHGTVENTVDKMTKTTMDGELIPRGDIPEEKKDHLNKVFNMDYSGMLKNLESSSKKSRPPKQMKFD